MSKQTIEIPEEFGNVNMPLVSGKNYQKLVKKMIELQNQFKDMISNSNLNASMINKMKLKYVLDIAPYIIYIYTNSVEINEETTNIIGNITHPVTVLQMMIHMLYFDFMGPNVYDFGDDSQSTKGLGHTALGQYDNLLSNNTYMPRDIYDFAYYWTGYAQKYLDITGATGSRPFAANGIYTSNMTNAKTQPPDYSTLVQAGLSNLQLIDFYTFWISWCSDNVFTAGTVSEATVYTEDSKSYDLIGREIIEGITLLSTTAVSNYISEEKITSDGLNKIKIGDKTVELTITDHEQEILAYHYFIEQLQKIYTNWDTNTNVNSNEQEKIQQELANIKQYVKDNIQI